jgi:membrane-associated phospholipid phosphatase
MTDLKISISKIFYKIFSHAIGSVKYNYGLNYLLAAVLTYIIVESGLDWAWHSFSATHIWIFYSGFISVIVGQFLPIIIPLWLYFSKDRFKKITGLALGQAAILGFAISTFIKLFTGRMPPELFAGSLNNSAGFQFGFYRGGWFNGWPSSHTSVAFAMAITLIQLYPNSRAVKIGAWTYAILIGLGVSLNIHWLSDAVAGGLIGYAIGKSIGRGFKNI